MSVTGHGHDKPVSLVTYSLCLLSVLSCMPVVAHVLQRLYLLLDIYSIVSLMAFKHPAGILRPLCHT